MKILLMILTLANIIANGGFTREWPGGEMYGWVSWTGNWHIVNQMAYVRTWKEAEMCSWNEDFPGPYPQTTMGYPIPEGAVSLRGSVDFMIVSPLGSGELWESVYWETPKGGWMYEYKKRIDAQAERKVWTRAIWKVNVPKMAGFVGQCFKAKATKGQIFRVYVDNARLKPQYQ